MQSTFEKVSSTIGTLKVEITEADYNKAVNKKINEYAKTAQVKGFRPGHVPVGYIKNLYGKSILVDEVIKVASDAVNEAIKENKINVVGEPTPSKDAYEIDWSKQTDFTFNYEIGFASDFTIDIDKIPAITHYEIQPGPEQVESTIEDLKGRFGKETEPETSELGDIVFGTLKQESSEFSAQSGIPTDKVKADAQVIFKGLDKGSSVSFDIQTIFENVKELGFATGKSDEEAGSLEGIFEFEVTKISRMGKGELNQELFDKVLGPGKASDETSFRAQLADVIKDNYKREADFLLDFDVDKILIASAPMEVPEEFLKSWLVEINKGKATAEDVEKEFPQIARGLKLDMIKSEIARQHDIKVEYSDVLEEVKNEIRGYFGGGQGFEGMEDFIDNMATKQLNEKKQEDTRKYIDKAFGRKVLNFTKDKIKKTVKTISVDEFNKVADETYKG